MTPPETASELHARLDEIEEKLKRVRSGGRLAAAHEREGAAFEQGAQALRGKLADAHGARWDDVKQELHREWEALTNSVDRWVARVDRSFNKR